MNAMTEIPADLQGSNYLDYLLAAARDVDRDASENPGAMIEVDPDVAEFMGANVEEALSLEEALESAFSIEDL